MPRFNPEPVVAVGEWPLSKEIMFQGKPAVSATARTLVNTLRITWGRDDILAQPDPITVEFDVFDPEGYWPRRIGKRESIGHGVTVSWNMPPDTSHADAPNGVFQIFAGFTTHMRARPHRAWTTEGYRDGWIVTITAADRTSTLANVAYSFVDLPADTMLNRAIRLRNDAAGSGIRQFYFDATYADAGVAPTRLEDTTARDFAGQFYTSTGDQFAYNPNRNVVNRVPDHASTLAAVLYLDDNKTAHVGTWAMKDLSGQESEHDKAQYGTGPLDGCEISSVIEASTEQSTELNRIVVKWKNRPANYQTINTWANKPNTNPPHRTISFSSWMDDGLNIDPMVNKVGYRTWDDRAGPHHPPVRYETAYTGGFINVGLAMHLTLPFESVSQAYLSGSPWFAALGIPPVVSFIGGTIEYAGGDWKIETNLARVRSFEEISTKTDKPWKDVAQVLRWKGDAPVWDLSEGVSWFDFKWITVVDGLYTMGV